MAQKAAGRLFAGGGGQREALANLWKSPYAGQMSTKGAEQGVVVFVPHHIQGCEVTTEAISLKFRERMCGQVFVCATPQTFTTICLHE